ncbi:hypothetical protein MARINON1_50332 [Marinobacter salarius]|nr:hypothetical protein MBHK15_120333 [Marinobacter salarius]VXB40445.1 hypothetical protein MARINON1_50332 [Marinobacter salarius]
MCLKECVSARKTRTHKVSLSKLKQACGEGPAQEIFKAPLSCFPGQFAR